MAFSTIGVTRFKVYGVLLLVNTIVLALSAHINHFQEFYYKADVLPFALSLTTMFFVLVVTFLDFNSSSTFTAYPAFELTWLFLTGMVWLAFNAFSTTRWRYIDSNLCRTIPGDSQYAGYRTWCREIQALRTFVWVEWVILLLTFAYIFRWAFHQHVKGRTDVWTTSISRSSPDEGSTTEKGHVARSNSEFLQFEGFSPMSASASEPQQRGQIDEYMGRGAGVGVPASTPAEPQFDFILPTAQYSYPTRNGFADQLRVQTSLSNAIITPDPFASPQDYSFTHSQARSSSPIPPSSERLIYPTGAKSQQQQQYMQPLHPYSSAHSGGGRSKDAAAASPIRTKYAQGQAQGESRYASSEGVV